MSARTPASPERFAPPAEATEISDNIYAYAQPDGSWFINNTGFLVGSAGVVGIDTCSTTRRTEAFLRAIARVSALPVRTLVNTHHHGDHTYGNYLLPHATIVGHDRVREALLRWGKPPAAPYWTEVEWGPIELAPPFLTYEHGIKLYVDDLLCEVTHVGTPAHTDNDSVIWIPERKVLFSGDLLFNGGTPFLVHGSISGAVDALGRLNGLGAETIVPGHGKVCGPGVIDEVLSYLRFVQKTAASARAAGLAPLKAARETDLGEFAGLLDRERIVGNLHRAYAEDAGAAPGAPIDVRRAMTETIEFNGGSLLECHA